MSSWTDVDDELLEVIDAIAKKLGLSRNAVIALAVQMLASKIRFPDLPTD